MELVYLWVEEYKNIKKQGFNFSPRFECEYDEERNELTVDEKKEYVSIFPENINVTAIVGENGSGKSNIFESLISNLMYFGDIPTDEPYKVLTFFYDNSEKKVYYKELNFHLNFLNNENILNNLEALTTSKYQIEKQFLPFTLHYDYSLDWINNNENNLDFDSLYHKNDDYETPILLQPDKFERKVSLANIDYIATRDILNFTIQNNIKFDFIEEFFVPVSCKLIYNMYDISKKNKVIYKRLEEQHSSRWRIEHFKNEAYCYILRKTIDKGQKNNYKFIKKSEFKNKLQEDKLNKNFDDLIDFIKHGSFEDLYDDTIQYRTKKIKDTFKFLSFIERSGIDFFGYDLLHGMKDIKEDKEILLNLPPYVQVEFFDKTGVSFYSLSYGQKFIIKFIYSLLNQLNNLKSHPNYRDINILLDEVEQGLHPEWQKKFVNFLVQILKEKKDFNFNIVCATHSPFILSDIPKTNAYFIKNGQKKFLNIETFGANIHTLLSHGFFMKDGLMGEYAKEKINEIIKFLETVEEEKSKIDGDFSDLKEEYETKKKEFWYIQSIIGEDYLKQVIKNHLVEIEKILLGKDEAKEEHIKRLQQEIDRLKKSEND